jgi:hypothetical protein
MTWPKRKQVQDQRRQRHHGCGTGSLCDTLCGTRTRHGRRCRMTAMVGAGAYTLTLDVQ